MTILHFLDVANGDCSIIQHDSKRVSVIDVCKARNIATGLAPFASTQPQTYSFGAFASPFMALAPPSQLVSAFARDERGEFPLGLAAAILSPVPVATHTNPIQYLREIGVTDIWRFVLTHPDMDHMDGIADLFTAFPPLNFWDTANKKTFAPCGYGYRDGDWKHYISIRDRTGNYQGTRLELYGGQVGSYWNQEGSLGPHDGLYVLAPTPELMTIANEREDWNDASYVILHVVAGRKMLFWGDAHDGTRKHVMDNYGAYLTGVDIMIAPHHGRDSGGDRNYLTDLKPKLTLFGNAPSEHLAYDAWRNRGLPIITNNQAGNIVVDASTAGVFVYVQKEAFARERNQFTFFSDQHRGWFLQMV